MAIDIGISPEHREEIAKGLSQLLADSYALYLRTHGYHWNVTGPMFQALHTLFEGQYNELWLALDEIAERIRALDHYAPASYAEFMKLSVIKDEPGVPDATVMIKKLVEGQEAVIRTARHLFTLAEKANDQPTADLLTSRMQVHEKNAWMLRSLLV